ncbi:hypothetical protein PI86_07610 [Burkholderia sp. A9]|uniref:hypothetical protein n=1 Tax=Burkholderia sp. A9 TaxID=1365108 RepID=UPI0005735D48|nr:hypothetical protein [Burkholderia sp. A9]KHK59676.1 hypothetical protein PI86_07610 [Burkholderia sp. A9]
MNKKRHLLFSFLCVFATIGAPLTARADFDAALFGMSGMVAGETARLSVTNISAPVTPPSGPCAAQPSFNDAAGNTVFNADGLPVISLVTVAPGASASLMLPAPSSATGLANRFAYRAVVRQVTTQTTSRRGWFLAASHDVFNATTGVTRVSYPTDPFQLQ